MVICTESTWWPFQIGSNSSLANRSAMQVLDGLLAQVVVDAEDVLGGEHRVDQLVELAAGRQVVPNGFSTTTRRHRSGVLSAMPVRCICLSTTGNIAGGMDR